MANNANPHANPSGHEKIETSNFLMIVLILLVSLAPTIIGLLKAKFGKKKPAKVTDAQLDVMEDGIKNLDK